LQHTVAAWSLAKWRAYKPETPVATFPAAI